VAAAYAAIARPGFRSYGTALVPIAILGTRWARSAAESGVRRALAVGFARSTHRPFARAASFAIAVRRPLLRAIAWRLVAPLTSQLLGEASALFVPRHREALARILVLPARAPFRTAPLDGPMERGARLIGRVPEPPTGEPLQHRIGMPRLQLPQRRQELLLIVRAERGRLSLDNDRPVDVARRHQVILALPKLPTLPKLPKFGAEFGNRVILAILAIMAILAMSWVRAV
jgi:hypothetical protein